MVKGRQATSGAGCTRLSLRRASCPLWVILVISDAEIGDRKEFVLLRRMSLLL
ncbi:hypothetical protein [uncultured Bradyrhizobium sp.]|jgi:hypothetical protein|uniref:hypothetical protein n=1 Tax=uncultured Bradyrhizobium sp. TaxID=199684 RepID=UPI002624DF55|nr:hypothetical protein [uncultured Bradyrhizobium sp.]